MFRKSKWYTRGWTLQELLAPPKLVFYDCQWGRIDDRRELRELIRKITGIRARIVCGHLSHTSVSAAEKMLWAAHRQTTRAEDIAYCLLGLFDVNMPLLYGEGPIKAFLRLQNEFLRGSEDESIFAWWVPEAVLGQDDYKPNFCGLLATSPRHFSSSGRIRNTTHRRFLSENRPTEITNRGIRLQLPLYPVPNDPSNSSYFALLHCHRQESENYDTDSHHIVIILQRLSPLENSFARIVPHVKAYFARGAQRQLEVHSETSMRPSSKWAWNVLILPTSELEISSILIRSSPELVITNSFFIDFSMAVTTLAPLEGDLTLEGLYRYNGHEVTEGGGGSVQIISNQANLIDCGMPPPDSSTSSTIRSLPKFLRMRLSFQPKPVVTWIPAWERSFDLQLGLESPCPN
ncbi:hypothetical protein QBC37DRAFT_480320 [Rhypophila decipiens]|uniref:DUF8212 domain-containing protein n=1 Tax=Rhypophila decipiens TaxID=261697 RepID=A0AAN7BAG5_9PEZI|nr:hypothetical protein QBC37DRAFT_480320 [Rhypophila decipiens]